MMPTISYLGWYVLTHGYALHPAPAYIAWCFGTGMFRATAEACARQRERSVFM